MKESAPVGGTNLKAYHPSSSHSANNKDLSEYIKMKEISKVSLLTFIVWAVNNNKKRRKILISYHFFSWNGLKGGGVCFRLKERERERERESESGLGRDRVKSFPGF